MENGHKVSGIILLMILCRFIVLPVAKQGHYASNINMYDLLHEYILDASDLLAKFINYYRYYNYHYSLEGPNSNLSFRAPNSQDRAWLYILG